MSTNVKEYNGIYYKDPVLKTTLSEKDKKSLSKIIRQKSNSRSRDLLQKTPNAKEKEVHLAIETHISYFENNCPYCLEEITKENPGYFDHIYPSSKYGLFLNGNLVLAHKKCNESDKSDLTGIEFLENKIEEEFNSDKKQKYSKYLESMRHITTEIYLNRIKETAKDEKTAISIHTLSTLGVEDEIKLFSITPKEKLHEKISNYFNISDLSEIKNPRDKKAIKILDELLKESNNNPKTFITKCHEYLDRKNKDFSVKIFEEFLDTHTTVSGKWKI